MRIAALALAVATGCASDPKLPDAASFDWQPPWSAKSTRWSWVPLPDAGADTPTREAFDAVVGACTPRDADTDEARVRTCLADRGFYEALCSDGLDNDGDGHVDHPDDPGCSGPDAVREAPACDDGLDNDGDGFADWDGAGFSHPDPGCVDAASSDDESRDERSRWRGR